MVIASKNLVIICILLLSYSLSNAQNKKKYKNWVAYKLDKDAHNFIKAKETPRTEYCKSVLLYSKNKKKEGELRTKDWQYQKDTLLKANDLIEITDCLLLEDSGVDETHLNLFNAMENDLLGPFLTPYGSFKFVEISYNSKNYNSKFGKGDSKSFSQFHLDKNKAPLPRLKSLSKRIKNFYTKGKGNLYKLQKKYKLYKGNKDDFEECLYSKQFDELLQKAKYGRSCHIMECPNCILIVPLIKTKSDTHYIKYKVYLFK